MRDFNDDEPTRSITTTKRQLKKVLTFAYERGMEDILLYGKRSNIDYEKTIDGFVDRIIKGY